MVVGISGGDRVDVRCTARGACACSRGRSAGSSEQGGVLGVQTLGGSVDSCRGSTTKGHVDDGLASNSVGSNPVHTSNDTRGRARTLSVQDLDTDQLDLLGDSIDGTSDDTGQVGTVTVLVGVGRARDKVCAHDRTASEIGVGGQDAGVDDVGGDTLACEVVVVVGLGQITHMLRNADETPGGRGVGLDTICVNNSVLFDVGDIGVSLDGLEGRSIEGGMESRDGRGELTVNGGDRSTVTTIMILSKGVEFGLEGFSGGFGTVGGEGAHVLVEDDDVRVRDGLLVGSGGDQGCSLGGCDQSEDEESRLHGSEERAM